MPRAIHLRVVVFLFLVLVTGFALNLAIAQNQPPAQATPPPARPTTADCMGCHDGTVEGIAPADRASMVQAVPSGWKLLRRKADLKRAGVSLTIDLEKMKKAIHGAECMNCHADVALTNNAHLSRLQAVDCNNCHLHDEITHAYGDGEHAAAVGRGSPLAPTCADCHGAHTIMPADDPASPMNRENVAAACGQCHTTRVLPGRFRTGAYDRWLSSIHAQKTNGRVNSTCSDCHDVHTVLYAGGPTSKPNVSRTCGRCHQREREAYETGVHGQALARGDLSSPTCTDCHGTHNVLARGNPESNVYGFSAVAGVCGACHQAERVNRRYGILSAYQSYCQSYHGLALRKGDLRAANCASCHGAHAILNSTDPRSSLNKRNLQRTCGACHPDIGVGVNLGKLHPQLDRHAATIGEKVQWWVRWFYLLLIPGVLGFMFLHNLIDWIKKVRIHLAHRRLEGGYLRLTLSERVAHIVLLTSFSTLVVSGFALTFGWKIPGLSGTLNEEIRADVHRVAAVVMTLWFIYHAAWVTITKRGRGYVLAMIPRLQDGYDLLQFFAYNLGLSSQRPKADRFSYVEKMEYLAMMWGTVVMVLTGAILWFEEFVLKFLPLWAIDVAHIIHLMEAILATLAIIIWHFYSVLFNPDVAPMATHWLTGRLTEEEMEHEHPRELERIKREEWRKKMEEAKEKKEGE